MRELWHIALHDLRMHLSDRSNVFFLLLMPLGFVLFFGLVTGGNPTDPGRVRVSLPVVNRDDGFLSEAFIEQLRAENYDVEVYNAAAADTTEFEARFIQIDENFTEDILAGEQGQVELIKKARSSISYDAAASVRLLQAQARFVGNLVRWDPLLEEGSTGAAAIGPAERGRFLALVAEPSLVSVRGSFAGQGRPVPQGMGQSVPGVMVMFIVMTVLIGGSTALTAEKEQGTLRRLATTPVSKGRILGGKVLGLTLLGLAQAGILVLVTEGFGRFNLFRVDFLWSSHLVGLLVVLIPYAFCCAAMGLFLSSIFRSSQQAESLGWLAGLAMSGLGGTWWPLEIVPEPMKLLGHFFPTAWAMDGFHALITFGHGPIAALGPAGVILGMGVLFAALGTRFLRIS